MNYKIGKSREIARAALNIHAVKLNTEKPFQWASGYFMPIYNDNRMFLFNPAERNQVIFGLRGILISEDLISEPSLVIAGTSTAGIPWAAYLSEQGGADRPVYARIPMIYVRDKPKDHGLKNQIEGIDAEKDLEGRTVVLIEDLISTGGSSAKAVQAVRDANGKCNHCVSIFNYGLDKAVEEFDRLNPHCKVISLLDYNTLLEVAKETKYINEQQERSLREWRLDPFGWGEKHGHPRKVA
ncbi:MAG: orotate phosphoribosyltransferase [Candidatus Nanoarchaeia archaeon]|nr:orotate phosphoribosyltransferase [Candidatus Nanoarchaeia archaeon]